jgi:membrane-bound lytic murein transglycosylase MltF
MALNKYNVQEGQGLFDVVLMQHGTLEALFSFLAENPTLTVNTELTAQSEVIINTEIKGDADITNKYITSGFITNNQDEGFIASLAQKQFQNGDAFDFQDGEPFEYN